MKKNDLLLKLRDEDKFFKNKFLEKHNLSQSNLLEKIIKEC